MEFVQAQLKDLQELTNFVKEAGLKIDYIPNNLSNFYIGRENGKIVVCGCPIKTSLKAAKEIRGVVTRPKNGIRTKQMNNFLCDKVKEEGYRVAYAVIDPKQHGMKEEDMRKYIEFLKNKKVVGYEEAGSYKQIKNIIPRYRKADEEEYKHKVLLIKHLSEPQADFL